MDVDSFIGHQNSQLAEAFAAVRRLRIQTEVGNDELDGRRWHV